MTAGGGLSAGRTVNLIGILRLRSDTKLRLAITLQ